MPIVRRTSLKAGYTLIPNIGLEDPTLSAKAKGLLAYMLSKPNDWTFYQRELQEHFTDGKDSIKSAMAELVHHGYIAKEARSRNSRGQLQESNWIIFDGPSPNAENPQQVETPVNQQSKNKNAGISTFPPNADLPTLENPTQENPQLLSTDLTNYLQDQSNNNNDDENREPQNPENQNQKPDQNQTPKYKDPITLYRENVVKFKPYEVETILDYLKAFTELSDNQNTANGIVSLALKQALDNDSLKMSYVGAILRSWLKDKVNSVEMAQTKTDEHKQQYNQPRNSSNAPHKKTWLDEHSSMETFDFDFGEANQ